MLKIGTELQNRYVIEAQIGKGGMGAVYLAVDHKFSVSSRVAIKETFYETPELAEAFVREARLLNSLHHPILPHVSDYFTEGDSSFLVMQYIEGEDVSERLGRDGPLPFGDVIQWTRDLLDGLDYLHSQVPPIIHRDIKPNNLKITPRGHIVLLDFGLAKEEENVTLGEQSVFGYSRRYSPLEQIEGVGTDARSDIFSLGATIYHLLTGRPPVDALARASAIVSGHADPLELASDVSSNVPESIAYVLHSALALNADQRFVSVEAMSRALEHALDPKKPSGEEVVAAREPSVVSAFPAMQAFKAEIELFVPDFVHSNPKKGELPSFLNEAVAAENETALPIISPEDAAVPRDHDAEPIDAAAPATHSPRHKILVPAGGSATFWPVTLFRGAGLWVAAALVTMLALAYGISRSGPIAEAGSENGESTAASDAGPKQPADDAGAVPADGAPEPESARSVGRPADSAAEKVSARQPNVAPRAVEQPVDRRENSSSRPEAASPKNQPSRGAPARRVPASEQAERAPDDESTVSGMSPGDERRLQRQLERQAERDAIRREQRRMRRRAQQNGWPF